MASQDLPGTEDLHDRSLGELLKQLSQETTRLVHQELELAKAELTQKGKQAGAGACSAVPGRRAGRPRRPDRLLHPGPERGCRPGWPPCSWPWCTGSSPSSWSSRARPS